MVRVLPPLTARPAAPSVAPVTGFQRHMLDQDADPRCTDDLRRLWILSHAVQVEPRVDLRRLRRAFDMVAARHDGLRMRFRRQGGGWQALIPPPGPAELREIDLGDLSDDRFHAVLRDIAETPMPLVDAPMAETLVLHCGSRGDVVLTRVHHLVADGHGMIVLVEDMLRALLGLPLIGRAMGHVDYLRDHATLPPARAAAADAFWEEMHRDLPPLVPVGRAAKGLEPRWENFGDQRTERLALDLLPDSVARLTDRAAKLRIGAPTLLLAALLESLCDIHGLDGLSFTMVVGRIDPAIATFIGAASSQIALPYRAAPRARLDTIAQGLAATVMSCFDHLPHPSAIMGSDWRRALVARGVHCEQFGLHEVGAGARARLSPFSFAFQTPPGKPQRFGAHVLTRLDLGLQKRTLMELKLVVAGSASAPEVALVYDATAHTGAEVASLADALCDRAGLQRRTDPAGG